MAVYFNGFYSILQLFINGFKIHFLYVIRQNVHSEMRDKNPPGYCMGFGGQQAHGRHGILEEISENIGQIWGKYRANLGKI